MRLRLNLNLKRNPYFGVKNGLESSPFTLYSASAGSGKTYALTKAYLKRVLCGSTPTPFRQLLALTFTNKAVEEMKTRILNSLHGFSQAVVPPAHQALFQALCHELSLRPEQLQQRAQRLLKRILHNYAFFEISTLDTFNHKVVRTFARDLQLSQSFTVELDIELLLEEAVGRLLERAGSDAELTAVLLAFTLEKIDEDKSWNITHDLMTIGKLLFQENHATAIAPLRSKAIRDFQDLQQQMTAQIRELEAKAVATAQAVLQEIAAQGFVASDFPRQTLPNHFKKIVRKEFNPKALYATTLEQKLSEGKILKAADTREVTQLAHWILERFLTLKHQIYQRSFLKNTYTNLVPLTLLNEMAKAMKQIEQERDILPITALNTLLAQEIKDQPAPFIYERMGEKYRHYYIDEFQDTSQLQWQNLIPLIGHALESEDENQEHGSLFLVGDVKQAIYRWRGGKAEQLLYLLQGKSSPFTIVPSVHTLDTNWRSYDQIVQFNNQFFTAIAPVLSNAAYQNLFVQGNRQKANPKSGGFVQLSFLDKDSEQPDEAYGKAVLDIIHQLTAHNYDYADLCILVRDNKKARYLANVLAQQHIPIISSEALLLCNNPTVRFLIALLKYMADANDREAAYDLLLFLTHTADDPHTVIATQLNPVASFLATHYGFHISKLREHTVLSILEHAIVQFDLGDQAPAYLTFLMDEVLTVEKKKGPGIYPFLTYWEQKKATLSIAAPDTINAVHLMTIHKAKGLEFPFVIFPFAHALLNDARKKKKLWTPAGEDWALDDFLVNATRDMLAYNPQAAQVYQEEAEKTILDALNVLYVALTRAVKGLYILTEDGKAITTLSEATSYADLFRYYLQQQHIAQNASEVYTWGTLTHNPDTAPHKLGETPPIPYITRPKDAPRFTPVAKSSTLWDDTRRQAVAMGNLVHLALGQLKTAADIPQVLENLKAAGHLSHQTVPQIQRQLNAVVQHPSLKAYFSDAYELWNEREILTPAGNSLRPDRMVRAQNQLTLIEYKTGKPNSSHQNQVAQYIQALEAMDFEVKQAVIVYIGEDVRPIFLYP